MTPLTQFSYSLPALKGRRFRVGSTWSQVLLHIVFSTKHRAPLIDAGLQPRLYEYIGSIIRGERGSLLEIGGVEDHVHLLLRARTDLSIAELVRRIKGNSSLWAHETFPNRRAFAWQEGYGVFSVSKSQEDTVRRYIQNQEEHHRGRDFTAELAALLSAHGVVFDPKYVFE